MRSALVGRAELVDEALRRALDDGRLETDAGLVRARGWTPQLTRDQTLARDRIVHSLVEAGAEPPAMSELGTRFGSSVPPLMRILEREGLVVQVEADRYYATSAAQELAARVRSAMVPGVEYAPTELREALGLSRKFLIPFLEYCDRTRVTERRGTGRVLFGS
jgi:selenocysteine-specific elongation factor